MSGRGLLRNLGLLPFFFEMQHDTEGLMFSLDVLLVKKYNFFNNIFCSLNCG